MRILIALGTIILALQALAEPLPKVTNSNGIIEITATEPRHIGALTFRWTSQASAMIPGGFMAAHIAKPEEWKWKIFGPLVSIAAIPATVLAIPADVVASPFRTTLSIRGVLHGRMFDLDGKPFPNFAFDIVTTSWNLFSEPKYVIQRFPVKTDPHGDFDAPFEAFFGDQRTVYIDAKVGDLSLSGHLNLHLEPTGDINIAAGPKDAFQVRVFNGTGYWTPNHPARADGGQEEPRK